MKDVFKGLKNKMDYNSNGGAIFLGINGVVIKAHGSATEKTIKNTVLQAVSAVNSGFVEKIKASLDEVDFDNLIKAE